MRINLLVVTGMCTLFSCTPHAYFKSSNNVSKTEGIIYLNDRTEKRGLITIAFENILEKDNVITFKADGNSVNESLNIKNIKYYVINGHTYVPKKINLYLSNEYHYLFVERLTEEKDRMQLYKLIPSPYTNQNGEEPFYYFFSFPTFSQYEVIDVNSSEVVPEFDTKMSRFVSGCATLADKIKSKDKKYYYTLFSVGGKREEVIKNIVKEYNACR